MNRIAAGVAFLSFVSMPIAASAVVPDQASSVMEVSIRNGDDVQAGGSQILETGQPFSLQIMNLRKHRKASTFTGSVRDENSGMGSIMIGSDIKIDVAEDNGVPRFNILVDHSELIEMKPVSINGETIDLPSIRSWSVRDTVVPQRDGEGWKYVSDKDKNGLVISVSLMPQAR